MSARHTAVHDNQPDCEYSEDSH